MGLCGRAGDVYKRQEQYGTPDDIYLHPASVFVAQFMGSPSMNMIPATTDGEKLILSLIHIWMTS